MKYKKSFSTYRRAPKKYLAKYFAIAGTLVNQDDYRRQDSTEHGQWRRLSAAFYPSTFNFPANDVAVVVRTFKCILVKRTNTTRKTIYDIK